MTPQSTEYSGLVNAIKNIAKITFREESGFSIEFTDDNDDNDDNDDSNDNEISQKKICVSLRSSKSSESSESSELLREEAENKLGGLLQLAIAISDEAIKRGPDSSPSETDIYACAKVALSRTGPFSIHYRYTESLSTTYAYLAVNKTEILVIVKEENKEKSSFALLKVVCEMGLSSRRMRPS